MDKTMLFDEKIMAKWKLGYLFNNLELREDLNSMRRNDDLTEEDIFGYLVFVLGNYFIGFGDE